MIINLKAAHNSFVGRTFDAAEDREKVGGERLITLSCCFILVIYATGWREKPFTVSQVSNDDHFKIRETLFVSRLNIDIL